MYMGGFQKTQKKFMLKKKIQFFFNEDSSMLLNNQHKSKLIELVHANLVTYNIFYTCKDKNQPQRGLRNNQ